MRVAAAGGSGRRGRDEDLSNATTEEILDVQLKAHGGGGRGGGGGGGGRRRSAYATRDLTQGSISRNLWFLAWPQMIEGTLNMLDRVADLFWAGRFLGFHAVAGLAVAQLYTNLVMTGRMGLDTGMQAMIARAIGANRPQLANHVALQAFTITGLFSILMATVGFLFTDFLLGIMGVSQDVVEVASAYMRIQFIGFGGQAFRMMTGSALQAAGDPMTPMKATTISRVAHIILTPVLFLGLGWFPQYDLAGAALANVIAQALGVAWNTQALFRGTSRLHLSLRNYYVDFPLLVRLVRIGAPASGTGMERSIVHLLLARLVTPFGDVALAAYGITRNLEMFTAMGSMGLGAGLRHPGRPESRRRKRRPSQEDHPVGHLLHNCDTRIICHPAPDIPRSFHIHIQQRSRTHGGRGLVGAHSSVIGVGYGKRHGVPAVL